MIYSLRFAVCSLCQYNIGEQSSSRLSLSRTSWVQLWLLRARPIARMAPAVRGVRLVYQKEGADPCKCDAHYRQCVCQRRRARVARRLRGVARKAGAACAHRSILAQPDGRGLSRGKRGNNADAHLKRQIMGRKVVVAVTNGRLDFGTWERIFYGEFDGRRRKRVLVEIIGE